jgi:hypothetical protein
MKSKPVLSLVEQSPGTFIVPPELVNELFTSEEILKGESRLTVKTVGSWQVPVSAFGLVVSFDHEASKKAQGQPLFVYGKRTLTNWKQCGYEAEGKVSINGKKRRAFTSSKLFRLPDNSLLSAQVLHLGKE